MSAPPVYKLEKDLCRCCHAEGSFLNLAEPVYSKKDSSEFYEKEVYSEMLKNCLDLEILPMEGDLSMMTYTICGDCVLRLREANNFKHQVMICEERFRLMYDNMVLEDRATTKVKSELELPGIYDEVVVKHEMDTDDGRFDIRFDDSDEEQPVIEIKVEETKKPKPKPRARPQGIRAKKAAPKKSQSAPSEASIEAASAASTASEDAPSQEPSEPSILERALVREKKKDLLLEQFAVKKDGKYNCIICSKSFDKKYICLRHYKQVHLKMKTTLKCKICNVQVLLTKRTDHMFEQHGVKPPCCNICQITFKYERCLLNHQKRVHMNEKRTECNICGKKLFSNYSLTQHMPVHKKKTFICDICNKEFRWKNNLIDHINMHTGVKRYSCKVCPNAFVQKASLNWHMKKHHPNVNFPVKILY